jgi:hypothetical protein
MKRAILIGFGLLMSLALVAPASAFVFVFADIDKTKDVIVQEWVTITKVATIDVDLNVQLTAAAEALALANQENLGNRVAGCDNGECPRDGAAFDNEKYATIEKSIGADANTYNTGIIGVNQSTGNMNNQGNNVAVAVTGNADAFANAESSAAQINAFNSVYVNEGTADINTPPQKTDLIQGSINYNQGVIGVNQSVGNMNNQLNNVAIAGGLDGVPVALSEADLGQINGANYVFEVSTVKTDTILNSINNNHGVVGVNQAGGNMNNQANVVAIAAIH